ncbi:TetR/AcrR family transcriptional regulator [Neolewinella agarilytica]|uniref:Transcriptional regulator, TetR family n=1 Tax=Neolewinella agarilytica TaxID=478744 RepID=A0A1H9N9I8_9BACT|nr:TetR/AcrR family transcriptional regulator [Neolewinella agarilytica]SER32614.1 transcriptional regulator, TetR family [Neolewinella agarilytica]
MAIQVRILPAPDLYLRDPQDTELGRRILSTSIRLMDELGLEAFTFKKLAKELSSAEASVYRYFSSKHQLLLYLVSWYWDWVHHLVNQAIAGEPSPIARLRAAVSALTRPFISNPGVPYIDEHLLHQLVINEGSKAYHTKMVDQENNKGLFLGYKSLTAEISNMLLEINPDFSYPHSLASSLFEMAHNHPYFAEHLPRLTDLKKSKHLSEELDEMLWFWVTRLLGLSLEVPQSQNVVDRQIE